MGDADVESSPAKDDRELASAPNYSEICVHLINLRINPFPEGIIFPQICASAKKVFR